MRSTRIAACGLLVMMAVCGLLAALTGVADAAAIERSGAVASVPVAGWAAPVMLACAVAGFAKAAPKKGSVIKRSTETDRAKRVLAILEGESDEEVEAVKPAAPYVGPSGSRHARQLSAVLGCLAPGGTIGIPLVGGGGQPVEVDLPTGGVAMFNLDGTLEVYSFDATDLYDDPATKTKVRRVKPSGDGRKSDVGAARPAVSFRVNAALPHVIWNTKLADIVQLGV